MSDKSNDVVNVLALYGTFATYTKMIIIATISLVLIYIGLYTIHKQTKYIDTVDGVVVRRYCDKVKIHHKHYSVCDYIVSYYVEGKKYHGFIPDDEVVRKVGEVIKLRYRPCHPDQVVSETSIPTYKRGGYSLSFGCFFLVAGIIWTGIVTKNKVLAAGVGVYDIITFIFT